MYIENISLENFRTFERSDIEFIYPQRDFKAQQMPIPRLRNVNLLLGNNGSGKTTLLKAVAMAALGPAVGDANLPINRLIRRKPAKAKGIQPEEAYISARFITHEQDGHGVNGKANLPYMMESAQGLSRRGEVERVNWTHKEEKAWSPIFSSENDAFFFVGYGATRRVESTDRLDMGARQVSSLKRAQRIRSLFEEAYSLIPFPLWLPSLEKGNRGRFVQVKNLINKLLGGTGYKFTGKREFGEYLFDRGGLSVPFPALSDGYRAFLGWVGDLLYHVCDTCPDRKMLYENKGIVMVDEIDLHLHPKWQMTVLPRLAKTLPNIQFIVTSHSPLIVGSLEWMNIIVMTSASQGSTKAKRLSEPVHGLDADQVLLTDFFGLDSTRVDVKDKQMKELTLKARGGDHSAASELLNLWSKGLEERN